MSAGRSEVCGVCIDGGGGSLEEKERNRRVGHWCSLLLTLIRSPHHTLKVPPEQLFGACPQKFGSSIFLFTIFARQAGLGFRPEARQKGAQGTVTTVRHHKSWSTLVTRGRPEDRLEIVAQATRAANPGAPCTLKSLKVPYWPSLGTTRTYDVELRMIQNTKVRS